MAGTKVTWKEPEATEKGMMGYLPTGGGVEQGKCAFKEDHQEDQEHHGERDNGVEEIVSKIQEARVQAEVAIKEWSREEGELIGFLNSYQQEVEETVGQQDPQAEQEDEKGQLARCRQPCGGRRLRAVRRGARRGEQQFAVNNK